jgi:hypothetical protein
LIFGVSVAGAGDLGGYRALIVRPAA